MCVRDIVLEQPVAYRRVNSLRKDVPYSLHIVDVSYIAPLGVQLVNVLHGRHASQMCVNRIIMESILAIFQLFANFRGEQLTTSGSKQKRFFHVVGSIVFTNPTTDAMCVARYVRLCNVASKAFLKNERNYIAALSWMRLLSHASLIIARKLIMKSGSL